MMCPSEWTIVMECVFKEKRRIRDTKRMEGDKGIL